MFVGQIFYLSKSKLLRSKNVKLFCNLQNFVFGLHKFIFFKRVLNFFLSLFILFYYLVFQASLYLYDFYNLKSNFFFNDSWWNFFDKPFFLSSNVDTLELYITKTKKNVFFNLKTKQGKTIFYATGGSRITSEMLSDPTVDLALLENRGGRKLFYIMYVIGKRLREFLHTKYSLRTFNLSIFFNFSKNLLQFSHFSRSIKGKYKPLVVTEPVLNKKTKLRVVKNLQLCDKFKKLYLHKSFFFYVSKKKEKSLYNSFSFLRFKFDKFFFFLQKHRLAFFKLFFIKDLLSYLVTFDFFLSNIYKILFFCQRLTICSNVLNFNCNFKYNYLLFFEKSISFFVYICFCLEYKVKYKNVKLLGKQVDKQSLLIFFFKRKLNRLKFFKIFLKSILSLKAIKNRRFFFKSISDSTKIFKLTIKKRLLQSSLYSDWFLSYLVDRKFFVDRRNRRVLFSSRFKNVRLFFDYQIAYHTIVYSLLTRLTTKAKFFISGKQFLFNRNFSYYLYIQMKFFFIKPNVVFFSLLSFFNLCLLGKYCFVLTNFYVLKLLKLKHVVSIRNSFFMFLITPINSLYEDSVDRNCKFDNYELLNFVFTYKRLLSLTKYDKFYSFKRFYCFLYKSNFQIFWKLLLYKAIDSETKSNMFLNQSVFFKFLLQKYFNKFFILRLLKFFNRPLEFSLDSSYLFYFFFFQLFVNVSFYIAKMWSLNRLLLKKHIHFFFRKKKMLRYSLRKRKRFQFFTKFFGSKMFINNFKMLNYSNICWFKFGNVKSLNLLAKGNSNNANRFIPLVVKNQSLLFFVRRFKSHNGCRLKKRRRL